MKIFVAIFLVLAAFQVQAFDPIQIDEANDVIHVWDFNHLLYCGGFTFNLDFVDSPYDVVDAVRIDRGVEMYEDDITFIAPNYWAFYIKIDADPSYEVVDIYLAELYSSDTYDYVDIGLRNNDGVFNFYYYYENSENDVEVGVNVPLEGVDLQSGEWILIQVVKNFGSDGMLYIYADGQEVYSGKDFPNNYQVSDTYDYGLYADSWPRPNENNSTIDVMYYVYGVQTPINHNCFQQDVLDYYNAQNAESNPGFLAKSHKNTKKSHRQKKDDQNPFVKKNDKIPFVKKDDQNPFVKKDDQNPFVKKNDRSPFVKKDDQSPFVKKDDQNPFVKKGARPDRESRMRNRRERK